MAAKPFSFTGQHYRVDQMTMLPPPVQKPRVPIWVPGVWPMSKSMDRALRWDGVIPQRKGSPGQLQPKTFAEIRQHALERRPTRDPFDIIARGSTPGAGKDRKKAMAKIRPFAQAGATWWIEHVWSFDFQDVRKRMQQGPRDGTESFPGLIFKVRMASVGSPHWREGYGNGLIREPGSLRPAVRNSGRA